jgi:RNA-directed DNA polymerase
MSTSETMMYEWDRIDWRKLELCAFKLQKRIYQASRRGDVQAVHKLQRLLIKSKGTALLAVRRVAQDNRGKGTAGVDGLSSLNEQQKLDLARRIMNQPLAPEAQPVRRVWIPKPASDEKRPLGIPVMEDRARQALVKMALEPEWEAKFEPNSYGFRPGRSCHDAIQAIFISIQQAPKYVLDADIAKCFDRINHEALLAKLGTFPELRRVIKAWLQAGIVDEGELFPTSEGTPQGGVISPLLMNVALYGLAKAIEDGFQKYMHLPTGRTRWTPLVVRYADDFVVIHRDLEVIRRVQEIASEWLRGMGLEMKPSKTRITHTLKAMDGPAGFEFLGFNIRQYDRGENRGVLIGTGERMSFTPSIRPSQASQKRLLRKVREVLHAHRMWPQAAVIAKLNPILRGWGNYFSSVVSKNIFHKMDHLIFWKLWAWALRRHPKKSRGWIARKYWHLDPGWIFKTDDGFRLHKLSAIPIRRHVKVQADRSPFDGDAIYWSTRLGKHPDLPWELSYFLKKQKGICPRCGLHFKLGDRLVYVALPQGDASQTPSRLSVLHEHCQDKTGRPVGMDDNHQFVEEPDEGKLSRPVLKTSSGSDTRA